MKLIKGAFLNAQQVKEVKSAFVHRYTGEHKPIWANKPMPNGQAYKPLYATDFDWLIDKAFYFKNDGHLASRPRHCEPVYMAET